MGLELGLVILGVAAALGSLAVYEALKHARKDANENFGNVCVGIPLTPCSIAKLKPISQAQADVLFKRMAASANQIPFDYPNDCCYSRAHEMCRMMRDQGIDCGKIWNYANPGPPKGQLPPGPPLTVNTPNSPSGKVTWRYHVAPIVDVQGSDGAVRTMVVDPSMFAHPVTVDEWRTAQHAPNAITQYDEHFDPNSAPYYRDIDGANADYDKDYSQTHTQLQIHQIDRDSQDPAFVSELEKRRQERVAENSR
jgi:Glutaminase